MWLHAVQLQPPRGPWLFVLAFQCYARWRKSCVEKQTWPPLVMLSLCLWMYLWYGAIKAVSLVVTIRLVFPNLVTNGGFKFDHTGAYIGRQLWIVLKLIVVCKRIMFTYIHARMNAPCNRKLTIIPKVGETITEDAYDVSVTKQQLHGKQLPTHMHGVWSCTS